MGDPHRAGVRFLGRHESGAAGVQPGKGCSQGIDTRLGQLAGKSHGNLVLDRRRQQTLCRLHSGMTRHHDTRDGELLGQRRRVQGSAAAKGHHGEVPRIKSLSDGHQAHALRHLGIQHPVDAVGRVSHADAQRAGNVLLDGACREPGIQGHAAAGKVGGVQQPQHQGGIGHRGSLSTAPVAGRPRIGTGGIRSDTQPSGGVQPRDAAPARADGVDVHHGRTYRIAVDESFRAHQRLSSADQGDVAARAADVHGDDVGAAGGGTRLGRADDARRGTGQEQAHGPRGRGGRGAHATPGLHHLQRRAHTRFVELRAHAREIARQHRLDVCIEGRHHGALVLAKSRVHLARQGQGQPGVAAGDDLGGALFVGRIQEREKETYGDGLTALVHQRIGSTGDIVLVQRSQDPTVRCDALAQEIVNGAADLASYLQDVAKARGGDDAGARATSLQHRIGRHGGAVHHPLHASRVAPRVPENGDDTVENGL